MEFMVISRCLIIIVVIFCISCKETPIETVVDDNAAPLTLLEDGRLALARADATGALQFFSNLEEYSDYACDAKYGQALAYALKVVELIDPFVVLIGLVQGADSVGDQLVTVGNFSPILFEAITPIETELARLRIPLQEVVEKGCLFELPQGYPVALGRQESELFFSAKLGYQWDSAAARLMLSGLEFAQALIDYVLAHRFSLGNQNADELINSIQEAIASAASDESINSSWVTAARLTGGLFDINPLFLDFSINQSGRTRVNLVDNDLSRGLKTIYSRASSEGETGILQDLLGRSLSDSDVYDNVLALIDNGDGALSTGDTLHFGIRDLTLGSLSAPDQSVGIGTPPVSLYSFRVSGPVSITFQPGFGNVGEAWRNIQEIVVVLSNQMDAVDDPSVEWRRLGVAEFNNLVFNTSFLAEAIPQTPPFIELDFVSFLTEPVPMRALVPYWYDPDTDATTPDVFVVEAESFQATTEPYVFVGDVVHFPEYFSFDTFLQSSISTFADTFPRFETDFTIAEDFIKPNEFNVQPVPYIAWQDPTFNGLVYIDGGEIPDAGASKGGFVLPDLWLLNRAVNAYLVWSARELSNR